ncbi:hypothetical protein TRAPUB_12604 [Trametes pubescens]|uniref:Secreted protein n=1 Tax=Trametes pubescens TaxID=154538 RepID=A0A1M2VTC9_TRAPU|nr:hypothetical protein TRAPUB_12604 [Trametes pubescens]
MYFIKALVAAFSAAAAATASGPLVVNTPPDASQCGITVITWSGGFETYSMMCVHLDVFKDDEVVESFRNIPETNATLTEFTWLTNIAAGQQVRIQVFDLLGTIASTALFTIQPGRGRLPVPCLVRGQLTLTMDAEDVRLGWTLIAPENAVSPVASVTSHTQTVPRTYSQD